MAESCDRDDFAQQETYLSSNQAVFPDEEIKQEVKQEVSTPIPGFPPLFQFAKVQTEASSWTSTLSIDNNNCYKLWKLCNIRHRD